MATIVLTVTEELQHSIEVEVDEDLLQFLGYEEMPEDTLELCQSIMDQGPSMDWVTDQIGDSTVDEVKERDVIEAQYIED